MIKVAIELNSIDFYFKNFENHSFFIQVCFKNSSDEIKIY